MKKVLYGLLFAQDLYIAKEFKTVISVEIFKATHNSIMKMQT